MVRVAVYVDGFNLYFGLRAMYDRKYLWLDLQTLAASLLRRGQTLEQVRYFTARVRNDPQGEQRQSDYLDALRERSPLVKIKDGRFQEKAGDVVDAAAHGRSSRRRRPMSTSPLRCWRTLCGTVSTPRS